MGNKEDPAQPKINKCIKIIFIKRNIPSSGATSESDVGHVIGKKFNTLLSLVEEIKIMNKCT